MPMMFIRHENFIQTEKSFTQGDETKTDVADADNLNENSVPIVNLKIH